MLEVLPRGSQDLPENPPLLILEQSAQRIAGFPEMPIHQPNGEREISVLKCALQVIQHGLIFLGRPKGFYPRREAMLAHIQCRVAAHVSFRRNL